MAMEAMKKKGLFPGESSQALAYDPVLSEQGVFFDAEGMAHFTFQAGEETNSFVFSTLGGEEFPLQREKDGLWRGTFRLPEGFCYLFLRMNGTEAITPWLPIGYGACRPMNYVEVPAPDGAFYGEREVPHGRIERFFYPSTVSGKTESALIYLPPGFDSNQKYPVLYLQHGHGENETGWVWQGRMNRIADNLLSEGNMVPMLIVMGCGMVQVKGRTNTSAYPRVLLHDLLPYVEAHYPVLTDREHRAMAGLSMGSIHTSMTVLPHPELFAYAGLFSGFLRHLWLKEQPHLKALEDPAALRKNYRVFFRAMGEEDEYLKEFLLDDEILKEKQVDSFERKLYPGAHEWQVWRKCLRDFLPKLFREE